MRQHAAGRDDKARPHIGGGRYAGGIVGQQLPVGMGAALEPMLMQLKTVLSVSVVALGHLFIELRAPNAQLCPFPRKTGSNLTCDHRWVGIRCGSLKP